MIKEFKDFIQSFISGNSEIEFTKQTYTEHGMIALGRSCGMSEEELKVLLQSINKIESKTKKGKKSFISELSQNGNTEKAVNKTTKTIDIEKNKEEGKILGE